MSWRREWSWRRARLWATADRYSVVQLVAFTVLSVVASEVLL